MSSFVHLNGVLVEAKKARISPFDHGFLYGDGVYESLITQNKKPFDVDSHLSRLHQSAAALDIPLVWSNIQILHYLEELLETCGNGEYRIRITVTRGENNFSFSSAVSPTLLIAAAPLQKYSAHHSGITVTMIHAQRFRPEVKSISLLPMVLAKQQIARDSAFEGIFCTEEGILTEGSVSNILLREKNTIFTTPSDKALDGTMQRIIVSHAKKCGYTHMSRYSTERDLLRADETCITNSVFGILPVRQVFGHRDDFIDFSFFQEMRQGL